MSSPDLVRDRFDDRLLAEAVRLHEQSGALAVDCSAADAAGRGAGAGFEHRIVVRAREIDKAAGLTAALANVRGAARFAVLAIFVLAAAAGAAAVQAAMAADRDGMVNVYVLLIAVLGIETVALILWCVFAIAAPSSSHGVPGRLVAELTRRLVLLTRDSASSVSASRAATAVLSGSALGRWAFAVLTHAAWAVFLSMAVATMLFLLSTRSYFFVWETTILSADVYVGLTRILAAAPEIVGFAAPGPADVTASQWLGQGEARDIARDAWSGLLLGSVVLYGLLPRVALLGLSALLYRRARRRFRLDVARPGYAKLAARLMPRAEELGFIDSGDGRHPQKPSSRGTPLGGRLRGNPKGPVAVLGLETVAVNGQRLPAIGQSQILDLGRVSDGDAFRSAVAALRRADPAPRLLIVVCSLVSTPDRGMSAYLDTLLAAVEMPLGLVLTAGQKLRERSTRDDVQLRLADWRALAHRAGIARERVLEVDLDCVTDASLAKLAAFAGETVHGEPGPQRLTKAFALIVAAAARWPEAPGASVRAELHRSIACLYRSEDPMGTGIVETPPDSPDLADAVRAAALLSLVLEAQGHDEMAITRMIDAAIAGETPELCRKDQIGDWLDRVHGRYRDAERRETRR